jgi:phage terminase large subunit-like protein
MNLSQVLWSLSNGRVPDLVGTPCSAGFYLGPQFQLSSFYVCAPLADKKFALSGLNWIPRGGKRDIRESPWVDWAIDRKFRVTANSKIDFDRIYHDICEFCGQHVISSIAFDPLNSRAFGSRMSQQGIKPVEFPQSPGFFDQPIRDFVKAMGEGKIIHGDDPILEWSFVNVKIRKNEHGHYGPMWGEVPDSAFPFFAAVMAFANRFPVT